jgi:hypothetical protein
MYRTSILRLQSVSRFPDNDDLGHQFRRLYIEEVANSYDQYNRRYDDLDKQFQPVGSSKEFASIVATEANERDSQEYYE